MKTPNCFPLLVAVLPLLMTPAFAQQQLDPPLKDWPAPRYWTPPLSSAERLREIRHGLPARIDMLHDAAAAVSSGPADAALTGALTFVATTPCRLIDTRAGQGKTAPWGPPSFAAGETRTYTLPSNPYCNVPANALAYSLNFTVFTKSLVFLSAWPAGQPFPVVSTLNALQGGFVANAAIVPAGTGGGISVYASDPTDVFIDMNGYYATSPGSKALGAYIGSNASITSGPAGLQVTHPNPGEYVLSFPVGSFGATVPVPVVSPVSANAVALSVFTVTVNSDGSGIVDVKFVNPGTSTGVDTSFSIIMVQN